MPLSVRISALACCAVLAALHGCGRDPAPTTAGALAGTYQLRWVNERPVPIDLLGGAVDGRLVLTRDGQVTRSVRYATSGVPGPIEHLSAGTYEVIGPEISYRVTPVNSPEGTPPLEAQGELRAGRLTFRYQSLPGGGLMEETYVREE